MCCVCSFPAFLPLSFGRPLILRVWRDLTHQQFQSVVLKNMARYLREGIRLPEVCIYMYVYTQSYTHTLTHSHLHAPLTSPGRAERRLELHDQT